MQPTFAVMILHVAASKWGETDVDSVEWCAMNFYDSIVRWVVPVFVMISGALFLKNDSPSINQDDISQKYFQDSKGVRFLVECVCDFTRYPGSFRFEAKF